LLAIEQNRIPGGKGAAFDKKTVARIDTLAKNYTMEV